MRHLKWLCQDKMILWYAKSVMLNAFYLHLKYSCGCFFSKQNILTGVKLRSYKIWKIHSLVDSHSLYQLLYLQVYRNDWKYEFLTLKYVLINKGKSNKKLPKMFADKNNWMTQKKTSLADLTKRRPDAFC